MFIQMFQSLQGIYFDIIIFNTDTLHNYRDNQLNFLFSESSYIGCSIGKEISEKPCEIFQIFYLK